MSDSKEHTPVPNQFLYETVINERLPRRDAEKLLIQNIQWSCSLKMYNGPAHSKSLVDLRNQNLHN